MPDSAAAPCSRNEALESVAGFAPIRGWAESTATCSSNGMSSASASARSIKSTCDENGRSADKAAASGSAASKSGRRAAANSSGGSVLRTEIGSMSVVGWAVHPLGAAKLNVVDRPILTVQRHDIGLIAVLDKAAVALVGVVPLVVDPALVCMDLGAIWADRLRRRGVDVEGRDAAEMSTVAAQEVCFEPDRR